MPVGTSAVVTLPGTPPTTIGPGRHQFATPYRPPADDPVWRPPFEPKDLE